MLHEIMNYIQVALPYLDSLGIFVYGLVFIAAFIESLPIIGVFLPGTAMLIFLGYAASEGHLLLIPAIGGAFLGAFLGEFFGYYLGKNGRHFLHEHKGWLKIGHVEAGRKFFEQHGRKSILIARFIGPIRSIISVVAGMSHMKASIFNFYNAIGAILWASLYMTLGFFFGQEWRAIDVYARKVSKEATYVLVIALCIYFGYRYVRRIRKFRDQLKDKVE